MPREEPDVRLTLGEKMMLFRSLFSPEFFKTSVRPLLFDKAGGDPELVHEMVVGLLDRYRLPSKTLSAFFRAPKQLMIDVNGQTLVPFGTSGGLDKNGDALESLSHVFGFMEPGTILVDPRAGNDRPRVAVDEKNLDVYNALGFPSKGVDYVLSKLMQYRKSNNKTPVYANVCGLPISEENAIDVAMDQMKILLTKLSPYVDGFVWNPASPNTSALKLLRNAEVFRGTAELMKDCAPEKLRLVKLWPYEPEENTFAVNLVKSFVEAGGHGTVVVNTKPFPKNDIPAASWGYPTGGRSGKFLKDYRLRATKEMRLALPDAVIVSCGGIYDGDDAYETFKAGANMIEGYTPYIFYGLGLVRELERGVVSRLREDGFKSLGELEAAVRDAAEKGTLQ